MKAQYDKLWEMRLAALVPALCVKHSHMSREYSQRLIRGGLSPSNPVTFDHKLGSIARDMVSTSAVGRYLLSARVFDIFRKESFTGWKSYPIILRDKEGKSVNGYEGLQITGRAGERDSMRGVPLPRVRGALIQKIGMFFQSDEWDGSDIFLCGLRICVTKRVQIALENITVDNIEFIRLDAVKMVMVATPNSCSVKESRERYT